jgi:hypothetical protein
MSEQSLHAESSGRKSFGARRQHPPAPLRTHSDTTTRSDNDTQSSSSHVRHKSSSLASGQSRASSRYARRSSHQGNEMPTHRMKAQGPSESIPEYSSLDVMAGQGVLSPPLTPIKMRDQAGTAGLPDESDLLTFDFGKIDYELRRAKTIGRGLWSTVFLADGSISSPLQSADLPSPPGTPPAKRQLGPSSLFAIKTPARSDAKAVFRQEARVLSHLMRHSGATQCIVPFLGLDTRNTSLVFEAVIGGSLDNLNSRLKHSKSSERSVSSRDLRRLMM